MFPLGPTMVTFEATDAAGNTGGATSTVTVTDQTAPVVTVPHVVTVAAVDATGTPASDPAIAAFLTGATADDNVDGLVPPPPCCRRTFPLGETTVTFESTDAAGNTGTATSTVTVTDQTPPLLAPPSAIAVAAVDAGGTPARTRPSPPSWSARRATDNVDGPVVASAVSPPAVFPLGATMVTFEATDAAGNTGAATSTVTVTDQTAPLVSSPSAIAVPAVDADGTPAPGPRCRRLPAGATAADNVDGPLPATAVSPPAVFPLGATMVTFEATDAAGNTGSATSTVTVTDQTAPVVTAPGPITVAAVDRRHSGLRPPDRHLPHRRHTGRQRRRPVPATAVSPPTVFPPDEPR